MEKSLTYYPKELRVLVEHPQYLGRMNAPDSAAAVKGPCGDEMEFYLVIQGEKIKDVRFFTEGCQETIACGEITARLAKGRTLDNALEISAKQVRDILKQLPADHSHCTILAVSTLYRAIANYLLKE